MFRDPKTTCGAAIAFATIIGLMFHWIDLHGAVILLAIAATWIGVTGKDSRGATMIQIPSVTQSELAKLLADVEAKGAGIHTTVTRESDTKGVIMAHPKIGFLGINVRADYSLAADATLTVESDHGEGQIRQKLEEALAEIRKKAV